MTNSGLPSASAVYALRTLSMVGSVSPVLEWELPVKFWFMGQLPITVMLS